MKKQNIFFLFILLACIFIFIINYKTTITEHLTTKVCEFPHLILNKTQLSSLRELLLLFKKICKENNIKYFAIGGTLVGTVRTGGFLPFDDDIDLGILDTDQDKIKQFITNYKSDVYYFEKVFFGYKLKKKESNVFIDIMIFENVNNKYVIDPTNNPWPESSFNSIDEILPLKKMSFNNIKINVPQKYLDYLNRNFPKWDKTIKIDCGHLEDLCVYDKHNLPQEFDINYQNGKYNCRSNFF
jgi:hypothetical protein